MNVPKEPVQDSNHLLIESHLIEISAEFVHTYQDCKKREISSKKRVSSYADGPFCKLLKIISVVIISSRAIMRELLSTLVMQIGFILLKKSSQGKKKIIWVLQWNFLLRFYDCFVTTSTPKIMKIFRFSLSQKTTLKPKVSSLKKSLKTFCVKLSLNKNFSLPGLNFYRLQKKFCDSFGTFRFIIYF